MGNLEKLEDSLRVISDIVTDGEDIAVSNKVYKALWDTIRCVRSVRGDMDDLEQRIEELENCI